VITDADDGPGVGDPTLQNDLLHRREGTALR